MRREWIANLKENGKTHEFSRYNKGICNESMGAVKRENDFVEECQISTLKK